MSDDLEIELTMWQPFHMTPQGAYAYWCAALEHAYRALKGRRLHELKGERHKDYDLEGLHTVSAAMGRAKAIEVLFPALGDVWRGAEPPFEWKPTTERVRAAMAAYGPPDDFTPPVRVLEKQARKDAEAEWLNQQKLGWIATGEVVVPEETPA